MEAFASDAKDLFNERIRIAGAISTAIGKSLKGEFDIDQMMDYIEQAAPEHIDDYVDLVTEQLQENCPWLFEV